jgi:nucleotide-binding universal stress UspA family protein
VLCFLSFIFVREREREREEVARRVAVAVDFSDCSKKALRWAVDNVVRDGDYLILLTVQPSGNYEEGEMQL